MVATETEDCAPGTLTAALQSIGETSGALSELAEQLQARRRDLDLLLGFDLSESNPRSKLYVLRPAGFPVPGFAQLCEQILSTAGVETDWTRDQLARAGSPPAFLAVDLRTAGSNSGKLYFSFNEVAEADALLRDLGCEPLRERLSRIAPHVSDNPNGRLVITTRARHSKTTDITLHAHLQSLPVLHPALQEAWRSLQTRAAQMGGRALYPSYASWLWGERPSESLYYTFCAPELRAHSGGS